MCVTVYWEIIIITTIYPWLLAGIYANRKSIDLTVDMGLITSNRLDEIPKSPDILEKEKKKKSKGKKKNKKAAESPKEEKGQKGNETQKKSKKSANDDKVIELQSPNEPEKDDGSLRPKKTKKDRESEEKDEGSKPKKSTKKKHKADTAEDESETVVQVDATKIADGMFLQLYLGFCA